MNSPTIVGREFKTLARQSSHYLFGLLGGLAFGFISFPIYTRVFSVADYGVIDYVQKILLLLVALSKAGTQNSVLRFYDHKTFAVDNDRRRSYYSTMLLGVVGVSILVTGLIVALSRYIPHSVLNASITGLLAFGAILIAIRSIQSIQWSFLRIEERTKAYNVYSVVIRAGTIAAVLALLPILGASVRTYFTGVIICESLVALVMVVPLLHRKLISIGAVDRNLLRASFIFGLPLVLQEIAGIVLDSGDRALVQRYLGANPLGYYSVAYGLSSYVNTLLMTPLGLAILPIYMRLWRTEGLDKTAQFLRAGMDAFTCVASLLLLLVLVGSRDAVLILASSKYAGSDRLIPILVAGLLIYAAQVFLNAGLLIYKRTFEMAVVLGVSATLNVVLNCVFLPRMGIAGAAWATLISYGFCTAWLAWRSFRVLPVKLSVRSIGLYSLALLCGWFVASRIPISQPFASLAVKPAAAFVVYVSVLLFFDKRARQIAHFLWLKARGRILMKSGVTVSL
jgi:O-antigen/teichoic acid export membrane protein